MAGLPGGRAPRLCPQDQWELVGAAGYDPETHSPEQAPPREGGWGPFIVQTFLELSF